MCRTRRGGPRTPPTTTDANLDCAYVENALVFDVPIVARPEMPESNPSSAPIMSDPMIPDQR